MRRRSQRAISRAAHCAAGAGPQAVISSGRRDQAALKSWRNTYRVPYFSEFLHRILYARHSTIACNGDYGHRHTSVYTSGSSPPDNTMSLYRPPCFKRSAIFSSGVIVSLSSACSGSSTFTSVHGLSQHASTYLGYRSLKGLVLSRPISLTEPERSTPLLRRSALRGE